MFGLLFSLAMPFMTTTYLLRGIDVPTILWGLLALFVGNVLLLSLAVLLGCMPLGPLFRRGGIVMGLVVFYSFMTGISMFHHMARGRPLFRLGGPLPAEFTIGASAIVLTVVLFTYATAVLILSPRYSNRFLPYRLTLTFIWALGLGVGLLFFLNSGWSDDDFLYLWLVVSSMALVFMLQVAECSSDDPSQRTLGTVPQLLPGRLVSFPFYSGGANGVVWALGLLAASYTVVITVTTADRILESFLVTTMYAVCYILTAGLVSRRFSDDVRQGAAAPWLMSLYFFATAAMVPLFLDLLDENRKITYDPDVEYGNVFCMFRGQQDFVGRHLGIAIPWLVLLIILNGPRLISAFQHFRRPPEPTALQDVLADEPKVEAFEA
jgi:hypothetical protein